MKVKLSELVASAGNAQQLGALGRLLSRDCPARLAFKLGEVAKAAGAKFASYNEAHNGLVAKYGKELDGQITVKRTDEAWPQYQAEEDDLLAVEVELPGEKLTVDELEAAGVKLSGSDAAALSWLIEG